LYWECINCLAVSVTVNSSITEHSATLYACVAVDGTFGQGAVFVDYKGSEGMPHNIITVRDTDVDSYKTLLLSGIGGIPPAKVE
jgi:Inosine-uridine nucleoside N-ribohydrolase